MLPTPILNDLTRSVLPLIAEKLPIPSFPTRRPTLPRSAFPDPFGTAKLPGDTLTNPLLLNCAQAGERLTRSVATSLLPAHKAIRLRPKPAKG